MQREVLFEAVAGGGGCRSGGCRCGGCGVGRRWGVEEVVAEVGVIEDVVFGHSGGVGGSIDGGLGEGDVRAGVGVGGVGGGRREVGECCRRVGGKGGSRVLHGVRVASERCVGECDVFVGA